MKFTVYMEFCKLTPIPLFHPRTAYFRYMKEFSIFNFQSKRKITVKIWFEKKNIGGGEGVEEGMEERGGGTYLLCIRPGQHRVLHLVNH